MSFDLLLRWGMHDVEWECVDQCMDLGEVRDERDSTGI
jgi:hypothetical protein